jgi:Leucine-rich repeat (LRR) protein
MEEMLVDQGERGREVEKEDDEEEGRGKTPMEMLPYELLLLVCRYLPIRDLSSLFQTCRLFADMSLDPYLWFSVGDLVFSSHTSEETIVKYVTMCPNIHTFQCKNNPNMTDLLFQRIVGFWRNPKAFLTSQRPSLSSSSSSSLSPSSSESYILRESLQSLDFSELLLPSRTPITHISLIGCPVGPSIVSLLRYGFDGLRQVRLSHNNAISDHFLSSFLSRHRESLQVLRLDDCAIQMSHLHYVADMEGEEEGGSSGDDGDPYDEIMEEEEGEEEEEEEEEEEGGRGFRRTNVVANPRYHHTPAVERGRGERERGEGGRGVGLVRESAGSSHAYNFLSCPEVTTLKISSSLQLTHHTLSSVTDIFPHVRKVRMNGCAWNRHDFGLLHRWKSLTHLDISRSYFIAIDINTLSHLPWLQSLHIQQCPQLLSVSLKAHSIASLHLDGSPLLSTIQLECPNLKKLSVSHLGSLSQFDPQLIPHLESLDVSHSPLLSIDTLFHIQQSCASLHSLNLTGVTGAVHFLNQMSHPWESVTHLTYTDERFPETLSLRCFPSLADIRMSNVSFFRHSEFSKCVSAMTCALTTVDFSSVLFGDDVIHTLLSHHQKSLLSLNLSKCKGLKNLRFVGCPQLHTV